MKNKKKIAIFFVSFLGIFLSVFSCYQIIQNVSIVHQFIFPKALATLDSERNLDEWNTVYFNGEDYLIFDSIFWDKLVTNDANSACEIFLRVKEKNSDVILDELKIPIGTSLFLEGLDRNTQYIFEVKASQEDVFINIS